MKSNYIQNIYLKREKQFKYVTTKIIKVVESSFKYIIQTKPFRALLSILYYNMNTKLLDLNNNILEITGDYVKKDNF